jgi:hypothetical protein
LYSPAWMSCRKKIGWRGPRRPPLSDAAIIGAVMESETEAVCCAREGVFRTARAATPPAATPPTTNANLRIIISPMRKNPVPVSGNARRSIVWAFHYTTRPRRNPTKSVGFTSGFRHHLRAAWARAEGRGAQRATPLSSAPNPGRHQPSGGRRAPASTI